MTDVFCAIEAVCSKANERKVSDSHLLPTHFDFFQAISDDIEKLKEKYDYVTVTDQELVNIREMIDNSLSFGDALDIILRGKCLGYKGLDYYEFIGRKSTADTYLDEELEQLKSDIAESLQFKEEDKKSIRVEIRDAYRFNGVSYYFFDKPKGE